jgi:molybdopterin-containing oxidoreductase family iron-sulfur binding subunit
LGATDPCAQATVLQLYDPDRSTEITERDKGDRGGRSSRTKDALAAWLAQQHATLAASGGQGLRVLAGPDSSPTMKDLKERFAAKYPKAAWVEWDPLSRDAERQGAALAFGQSVRVHLALERADVIAAFDADLLFDHPAALAHARAWARRRRATDGGMNRMYVVESAYSLTGGSADHRIAVKSALVPVVLGKLAQLLLDAGLVLPSGAEAAREAIGRFAAAPYDDPRLALLAKDLLAARGRGVICIGPRQPAGAHALAHALKRGARERGCRRLVLRRPRRRARVARPCSLEARDGVWRWARGHADRSGRQSGVRRARRLRLREQALQGSRDDSSGTL